MITDNPLLHEIRKYPCRCQFGPPRQYGCPLCARESYLDDHMWMLRKHLQSRYAWAIPNEEALTAIAALSPLVEIGAGTGYWAALLAARGADVVAYDKRPGRNNWCNADPYHPIRFGSWESVTQHPDRTLFLCWPPMSHMAASALRAYRLVGGQQIAYIGEYDGGCCATDRFFQMLHLGWTQIAQHAIPQWWGLHDVLSIWQRRSHTSTL